MSYHILHQFDEQWFADSGQGESSERNPFSRAGSRRQNDPQISRARTLHRPWFIITASLIIAACALYFAIDARRQTAGLKQRLTDIESKIKK